MAFPATEPRLLSDAAQVDALPVLLAPLGQLSADGQLRELIGERRGRHEGTGPIWYLRPDQVAALGLDQACTQEAVVTTSAPVLTWLQLRFGGRTSLAPVSRSWLDAEAKALPPSPRLASFA